MCGELSRQQGEPGSSGDCREQMEAPGVATVQRHGDQENRRKITRKPTTEAKQSGGNQKGITEREWVKNQSFMQVELAGS